MSRCKACDNRMTDSELMMGDDLCRKCLYITFGDSKYAEVVVAKVSEEQEDENS